MNSRGEIFQIVQKEEEWLELFHADSFLVAESSFNTLELLIHVPLIRVAQKHLSEFQLRNIPFTASKRVELELEDFSLENIAKKKNLRNTCRLCIKV